MDVLEVIGSHGKQPLIDYHLRFQRYGSTHESASVSALLLCIVQLENQSTPART